MKQDSHTSEMIFSVQEVIEHLSSIMTLESGDIIRIDTPSGTGFGGKEFLQPNDEIVIEVKRLGRLVTYMRENVLFQQVK